MKAHQEGKAGKNTSAGTTGQPKEKKSYPNRKKTGRRPLRTPAWDMGCRTEEKTTNKEEHATRQSATPEQKTWSGEGWSSTSENLAPLPKRLNQKKTPPTGKIIKLTQKPMRNRPWALANVLGNSVRINTIGNTHETKQIKPFNIE